MQVKGLIALIYNYFIILIYIFKFELIISFTSVHKPSEVPSQTPDWEILIQAIPSI